ncbi:hypothetical protein HDU82_005543 [Entophlyctis luteolus]|nr:hypothetical protein HDU82_005543 [Entophlyctis luteolus]
MKAKTLQINWHARLPVFCIAYAPKQQLLQQQLPAPARRLATSGGDQQIRSSQSTVFRKLTSSRPSTAIRPLSIAFNGRRKVFVEYPIPSARGVRNTNERLSFVEIGNLLASGGDDGTLVLWQQTDRKVSEGTNLESSDDVENKEHWRIVSLLRGCSADIYDIAWSPDGSYILAGCVDYTARVWDVKEKTCIHVLTDHSNFVQGVSWDPLDEFFATQSCDRSVLLYKLSKAQSRNLDVKLFSKHAKVTAHTSTAAKAPDVSDPLEVPPEDSHVPAEKRAKHSSDNTKAVTSVPTSSATRMFYDDTLPSFFRRLSFSPDGAFLVAPAGIYRGAAKEAPLNVVYVFARENLRGYLRLILSRLSGFKKPAIAVRFSPVLYEPRSSSVCARTTVIDLPYRMVFAVATQDALVVYDTARLERPLAVVANMHFGTLTDLSWAPDGLSVMMSATDGYCSIVTFSAEEMGLSHVTAVRAGASNDCAPVIAKTSAVNVLHAGLVKKKKSTAVSGGSKVQENGVQKI